METTWTYFLMETTWEVGLTNGVHFWREFSLVRAIIEEICSTSDGGVVETSTIREVTFVRKGKGVVVL